MEEAETFITQQQEAAIDDQLFVTTLHGKQLEAYSIMSNHYNLDDCADPLRTIISGTAEMRKISDSVPETSSPDTCVATPGVATFNIVGHIQYSLLALPTKGDFKDLYGPTLQQ